MSELVNRDSTIARLVRETRSELQKVSWPTWETTRNLSLIVIAVTIAMSLALGMVDLLFSRLFQLIVGR